ncbi:DUF3782 domain-containing protein [Spirosoma sp. BT702]|uniref:DUF3782 domain-containing protein n=1 Tax=Spirosoma profusum TaxID=2771354 RepID=A0A927ASW9_9BACT|nr:DUF3782 domain-containing protein [Spirosoma profusum]MBD2704591.1 DUF3782 domain-containing protein [Spirosoma profusum]
MESNTGFEDIRAILKEVAEKQREITEQQRENDKEISRVAKIVGDIGNKFGTFTEGMAFPSMDKVLRKQFGVTTVTTNYTTQAGADTLEIDVLGLANRDANIAVIVEVKSHLRKRDIDQTLKTIDRFRRLHPEHASKKLYGVIACVSGSKEQREEAQRAGLFVASIHDEVFELKTLANFVPKDFSAEVVA